MDASLLLFDVVQLFFFYFVILMIFNCGCVIAVLPLDFYIYCVGFGRGKVNIFNRCRAAFA